MSTNVAILGTGFAGLAVARALAKHASIHVTAINRENFSLFTPMLPEVASGSIEPRHIAEPFRSAVPDATFVLGEVEDVDFAHRRVATRHPVTGEIKHIAYDHVVLALGSITSTHGVPGAGDHSLPLKTLDDAIRLRAHIIACLEAAAAASDEAERRPLLTIVVIGGGFTGVEAAGELCAFMRAAVPHYRDVDPALVRVVLVGGGEQLLEQLPARFGARALTMFAGRDIEVVLNDDVAAVDAGGVRLKSGTRYRSRTVVWSAGVRVSDLVRRLDVPHTEHHAIQVDPDCSVPGRPGAWAAGDCASIPKPGGGTYPQTAQDAVREGALLAKNIAAAIAGKRTRPFRYRSPGMMASLGGRQGLADIGGRLIAGFPAWLLWRAYYLTRLPGSYRKARVALDWTLSLGFREDIASIR